MRFRSTTTSGSRARRCIRKNKSVPPASTLALPACCRRSATASPTLVGSKYSKFFKASSPIRISHVSLPSSNVRSPPTRRVWLSLRVLEQDGRDRFPSAKQLGLLREDEQPVRS